MSGSSAAGKDPLTLRLSVSGEKKCPVTKCKALVRDGDSYLAHLKSEHPEYNPQSATLFNFKCFRCVKCKGMKSLRDRSNGEKVLCTPCDEAVKEAERTATDEAIPLPGDKYTESISISWTVTAAGKDVTEVF